MNVAQLIAEIKRKQSYLCVGLDTDITKLPDGITKDVAGILQFNKEIIDATKDFAVSYKINTAFYEQLGSEGWRVLEKTRELIPSNILSIADAKRGDIGNTSTMYAKAFFEDLAFDSVTVVPYMGKDSVEPFLEFSDKHTIILALTSNNGAFDFQTLSTSGKPLYHSVLETSRNWKNSNNLMYVVGATKASYFSEIRKIVPNNFLLVPGVGIQGGSLTEVCRFGMNHQVGLLINSSRDILYASSGIDFSFKAAEKAKILQYEMASILEEYF